MGIAQSYGPGWPLRAGHVLLLYAILAACPAGAEPPPPRLPLVPPTSLDAESALDRAERLIENEQWVDALQLLQQLSERQGCHPVWNGNVYIPLRDAIAKRMAGLPADALRTYETLNGPAAQRLYEQALREHSEAALKEVAARYFCTHWGDRALSALSSLQMDRGRFAAALVSLRRIEEHPNPNVPRSVVLAKELTCLATLGMREEAERLVAESVARGVTHIVTGSRTWESGAFAAALFDEFATGAAEVVATNNWPAPGGNAAGNRIGGTLDEQRLVGFACELPDAQPLDRAQGVLTSVIPVGGGDTLFVKRGGVVFAVDIADPAEPRVKWRSSDPAMELRWTRPSRANADADVPPAGRWPMYVPVDDVYAWKTYQNHGLSTLALDSGRLYYVHADFSKLRFPRLAKDTSIENVVLTNAMRCVAAESGEPLWEIGGADPASADQGAPANKLGNHWFFTAPTVVDQRAYVLGYGPADPSTLQHKAVAALCLDAATGATVWQTTIGRLRSTESFYKFCFEFFFTDVCQPSVSEGVAVFPTGQGLVVACDAANGDLLWMAPYPVRRLHLAGQEPRFTIPIGTWVPRQPIIRGERCVVGPYDSESLFALELGSGRLLWKYDAESPSAVLGCVDERLYVQSEILTCLDARDGRVLWQSDHDSTAPESAGRFLSAGMGALGRRKAYVPARGGVRIFGVDHQASAIARYLGSGDRPPEGNAVLLDDRLILASPDRIVVCPSERYVFRRADAEVAAEPRRWQSYLNRGIQLTHFDRHQEAVKDLERALAMAQEGGADVTEAKAALALCYAQQALQTDDRQALDQAAQLESDDAEVRKALALARLRLALADVDPEAVAAAYAQLCEQVGRLPERLGVVTMSYWAHVADALHNADVAEGFRTAIERAYAAGEAAVLGNLSWWTPFEDERTMALLRAGALWRDTGQEDKARQAYSEILVHHGESAVAPEAFVSLLKVLESRGHFLAARECVELYAAQLANGRLSQQGSPVTVREWVEGRLKREDYAQLPTGGPPVSLELQHVPSEDTLWEATGVMLKPEGRFPPSLHGRILTLEEGAINCLDHRTGVPLWTVMPDRDGTAQERDPAGDSQTLGYGEWPLVRHATEGFVIVAPTGFYACSGADGALRWRAAFDRTHDTSDLPPHVARRNPGPLLKSAHWDVGALAACRFDILGAVTAVDTFSGQALLAPEMEAGLAAVPVVAGMRLFLLVPNTSRLLAFDLKTGAEMARWELDGLLGARDVLASEGGLLHVAGLDCVLVIDTRTLRAPTTVPLGGEFNYFVHVGDQLTVVATSGPRIVAFDPHTGRRVRAYVFPERRDRNPVWGALQGDVAYYLESVSTDGTEDPAPARRFGRTAFSMAAVRVTDGTLLWREWVTPKAARHVSIPTDGGKVWIVLVHGTASNEIVGLDKRTGRTLFRLSLAGQAPPRPFTVDAGAPGPLVRDDILIVPLGAETLALSPSEVPLE